MAYSFMVQSLTPGLSPGGQKGKKKVAVHHQQETEVYLGTISRQSEWLQSKSLQIINAGEGVKKREPSYTVGGNAN